MYFSDQKLDHTFKLKIDSKRLIPIHSVKYLGVLLDEPMSWNQQMDILSKLRSHTNLNTLRIAYYSLFQSHLQYDVQLWDQKNKKIKEIKDHKILKFTDILKVQNRLFMYQAKQNNSLATSFPALHSRDKHNYQTRSATQNLLDVPLARPNKYGKGSVKYQCIGDWNNLKRKFPQIPENKLSNMKIKRTLKKSYF